MLQGMEYEDREVFLQVMDEARFALTDRQFQCLLMQLMGYEQAEIGQFLGIAQPVVCQHFQAALDKVEEIAKRYLYGGELSRYSSEMELKKGWNIKAPSLREEEG